MSMSDLQVCAGHLLKNICRSAPAALGHLISIDYQKSRYRVLIVITSMG